MGMNRECARVRSRRWAVAGIAVAVALTSCSGARHRNKVAGPPPEYELPEESDAWSQPSTPREAGPRDAGIQ
jgi:hypothetical protein